MKNLTVLIAKTVGLQKNVPYTTLGEIIIEELITQQCADVHQSIFYFIFILDDRAKSRKG